MGFFKRAGLDVEMTTFTNSGDGMAAVAGGGTDVMGADIISFGSAVSRGIPLVIIAGGSYYFSSAPITLLCVAKNAKIAKAKDFEGQTIAVFALGGLMYTFVQAWLDQHGADSKKVHFVELPSSEMGGALARRAIAGAVIPEPALTAARSVVHAFGRALRCGRESVPDQHLVHSARLARAEL